MNAPSWLPAILAALMIVIAAYSLWRMVMSRVLQLPTDLAYDAVVFLVALATAGMLVQAMHVLRPGVWAGLLALAGITVGIRGAVAARRADAPDRGAPVPGAIAAAAGCAIAVYMLLAGVAPSTISGSTAGYYTMAGMPDMYKDTTITFPALGIVLAVVLLGYAVSVLDRIAPSHGEDRAPGTTSAARVFAPRAFAVCEVVIVVTMAYAILAKLV